MFQAIWNVAAGFCLHEANAEIGQQHFGHHQSNLGELVSTAQHGDQASLEKRVSADHPFNNINLFDDHHDHLPSCAHYIAVDATTGYQQPNWVYDTHLGDVIWHNLYQSPVLGSLNPPPELRSL